MVVCALFAQWGCVGITTYPTSTDRVSSRDHRVENRGPASYEANVQAGVDERGFFALGGVMTLSHPCDQIEVVVNEHTATKVREPVSYGGVAIESVVGLGGAGLLAWGIHDKVEGEPFRRDGEVTSAGAKAYLGALASVYLIHLTLLAVNSVDDEEVTVTSNENVVHSRCDARPAPNVNVTLVAGNETLGSARTATDGSFQMSIPSERVAGASVAPILTIDSSAVPAATGALRAAWEGARAKLAPVAAVPPARPRVSLHGVELKRAERRVLEAALQRAGAVLTAESNSRNISVFDVSALQMPSIRRLKVMFDGDDRFVQAKYEGDADSAQAALLRSSIERQYGPPSQSTPDTPLLWTLDAGLEISFRGVPANAVTGPVWVLYVDREAERALRDAVSRGESARE